MSPAEQAPDSGRPSVLSPEELARFLNRGASRPVEVTPTRNRVSMLTVETRPEGRTRVRLHESFLAAPPEILLALKRYLLLHNRRDWDMLKNFAHGICVPDSASLPVPPRTDGHVYDLADVFERVNQRYFEGEVNCRVTWGRRTARRRARSIRYGSYDLRQKIIRIHPALDDPRVPPEFVDYIMFHEMLHHIVPPLQRKGRWYYHHEQFRKAERSYPDWPRMQQLSRELLPLLSGG